MDEEQQKWIDLGNAFLSELTRSGTGLHLLGSCRVRFVPAGVDTWRPKVKGTDAGKKVKEIALNRKWTHDEVVYKWGFDPETNTIYIQKPN